MGQAVLDELSVVCDAELVGHGQQQCVRRLDRLVHAELLDEHVGLGRVGAPEDRAGVVVDHADLVLGVAAAGEVRTVGVGGQREDAAAHRDPRLAGMPGLLPRLTVGLDLFALLDVKRFAGFVVLERRALEVEAEPCGPDTGRV